MGYRESYLISVLRGTLCTSFCTPAYTSHVSVQHDYSLFVSHSLQEDVGGTGGAGLSHSCLPETSARPDATDGTLLATSPSWSALLPARWTEEEGKLFLHRYELEVTHPFLSLASVGKGS